ncbi:MULTISPECIES: AraC family transcriptional regulator [unclassified Duganella]|uniref:helix-turn-helix domain-containing protein n=1 Tax=unclassified Duganella TaxID=2636909 RepID=UPI000E346700|nr:MULTISPECIES: helix-turn-helix transcriptional regulator [unclassified Duganella]RFP15918.1 AraC family transcriptional regulator [Duganella sp. BJB475]RFP32917.1 AraC family transcriptional regulator [Duganella sp. BJB476]
MGSNYYGDKRLTDEMPIIVTAQHADHNTSTIKQTHHHPEGQMYIPLQGVIVIEAGDTRQVLPRGRVGWIPPNMPHGASAHGNTLKPGLAGYTVHLAPSLCVDMPAQSRVMAMSPLAVSLLERMSAWPNGMPADAAGRRLMTVFLDEVRTADEEPLHLTMPSHPRLQAMAAAIADNPADETDLDEWAAKLGWSRRSLTRHFRHQTGMSLVEWRQVARLQKGMELLNGGASVTTVALSLGYDSVSSFIALFRRILGVTPARFAQLDT